jgi:hypothetical protein
MKNAFVSKLHFAMAACVAVVIIASSASAETILAYGTRVGNAGNGSTHVAVPLNDAQATSLTFKTAAVNKLVKITYNAECAVSGSVGSWVSVTILVDGVEANPASGVFFAFCTATNASTFTFTGAVRQSLITVPAKGTHTVQVIVDLANADAWWLGDSSIVVEQK